MQLGYTLSAFALVTFAAADNQQRLTQIHSAWNKLNDQVEGRLFQLKPFAAPCFSLPLNSPNCIRVMNDYRDEVTRTENPAAYIQLQWETCQSTSSGCLIDPLAPNVTHISGQNCSQGSVSTHYIEVQKSTDITAAFDFSRATKIPLVVKNTGHDYNGRSSAPGSLQLWTHGLKNITYSSRFTPERCTDVHSGMTIGAGVQWGEAYSFAEKHNVTVVGGSDKAVGAVGGWLQGGGHSPLSNTMGLGVDRVLQYKVVTPDGKYRVANECQNKDLFFALRGGGGGTFGVVMEATVLASPRVTVQTFILQFSSNRTLTQELWSITVNNSLQWSADGWGGLSMSSVVVMVNPKLSKEDAEQSLSGLITFGDRLQRMRVPGLKLILTEFPSWGSFFDAFTKDFVATVGSSLALTSRLISKSNFDTPEKRQELTAALLATDAETPGLIILMTTPASVPSYGKTSVTEAWRSSLYHVTTIAPWGWNATKEEKSAQYKSASASIDHLRKITPDAAYFNEADTYEPNHEVAFWGSHYPELLRIKAKYDPDHLLDCWHCVGWNPKSPRFSCYL